MKLFIYNRFTIIVFLTSLILISCKKNPVCENCTERNKPPTAKAGSDQTIVLPKDSVMLDGSSSLDADGTIIHYNWAKISGPASANIINSNSPKTIIKSLMMGVYQFQLTVTDNNGLTAKDTVKIMVDNPGINQPPVACAGPDQLITIPVNSVTLNGSCSSDPDNNITGYLWAKISGPSSFKIANPVAAQTQVTNLVQGNYLFVITVLDAGGLFTEDTIQVKVFDNLLCTDVGRTRVSARITSVGLLSKPRSGFNIATAGSKIVIAGGDQQASLPCAECPAQVDIYDTIIKSWTTAKLSQGRYGMAALSAGGKIFFAGGTFYENGNYTNTFSSNVDIYDAVTNTWSLVALSEPRAYISAAAVGNKVFFAGGSYLDRDDNPVLTNRVDMYDLNTLISSTGILSLPRTDIAAVTAIDKIFFAGGSENYGQIPSAVIDIYDNRTHTWTTSTLQTVRGVNVGAFGAGKIFWNNGCTVEILNVNTGITSFATLSRPGSDEILIKGKNVIFLRSNNIEFDIYDTATETWSIGVLPQSINIHSAIVVNNSIYLNDGREMWKLEF